MDHHRYDVIVVGAGPSGLTTALAATRAGARVLVVDKHPGTTIFPKATGLRPRTMEVLDAWGLGDQVRAGSQDLVVAGTVRPVLTGPVLQEFPLAPVAPDVLARMSPATYAVAPQDHVEPVLLGELLRLGGEAAFGVRVVELAQHDDGVGLGVDRDGRREWLEARWVVGADGADSTVRDLVGLGVEVLGDEGSHLSTVFRADLARHLTGRRYALDMVLDGDDMLVFVPSGLDGRWMFDRALHPERGETPEHWTAERTTAAIRTAAGVPDLEVEIVGSFPWSFAAAVASGSQAGRVFLVGDAAHRTTPRGATGMNTGIADGHNLGWKLGWVARGLAGEALLATYAEERHPVGLRNALASLEAFAPDRGSDLSHDFGVVYSSAAVQPHDPGDLVTEDGAVLVAAPGARAPHAWVTAAGRRLSTIDLFEGGLTVLAAGGGAGWREAAEATSLPVRVLVLGEDVHDADGTLETRYRLGSSGAVVVRPDGHVSWRLPGATAPDRLEEAITATLGGRPVVTSAGGR